MALVLGGRSIQLARVFGIRIGVHPSWFVVLFLIVVSLSDAFGTLFPADDTLAFVLATASAFLFFGSVILHELGHALVARRNGIEIAGIDLWLFGGMALMRRDTRSPGAEFRVAVAGPVVTVVVIALCAAIGVAAYGTDGFESALRFAPGASGAGALLGFLAQVNLLLLAFNLLPGLPLDGGRIARAIAWKVTGDRVRATRIAAVLGRGFGYAFAALGVFLVLQSIVLTGVWMIFIGLFLAQAARSTETQSRLTARIADLRVADVMDSEPVAVPAGARLDAVYDEFFVRYGWPWFPVVDSAGRLMGVVESDAVEQVPEPARAERTVAEVLAEGGAAAFGIPQDEPLDALLGSESLHRLGALMAVDAEGVLRGVVTIDRVRRALRPAAPPA